MTNSMAIWVKFLASLRICLLLILCSFSVASAAQEVLAQASTGTLQLMRQDDGYVTISGRNYGFENGVTRIFLGSEEQPASILDEGMVVRYTLNGRDVLVRIEIIGPAEKLRILQEN